MNLMQRQIVRTGKKRIHPHGELWFKSLLFHEARLRVGPDE